jgi:LysM repeat protein
MNKNVNFFLVTSALLTILWSAPLRATPQESLALQEVRLTLENIGRQLHSQGVELSLFQERALSLEKTLSVLKQEIKAPSSADKTLERRVTTLEKGGEALVSDLKSLKNYIHETNTTVTQCLTQLGKVERQLTCDIQTLKSSIQSMLALLQGEGRTYIVKPGDSLGQIALEQKTDIKTLKQLNNLSSDTIFSGQRLTLP